MGASVCEYWLTTLELSEVEAALSRLASSVTAIGSDMAARICQTRRAPITIGPSRRPPASAHLLRFALALEERIGYHCRMNAAIQQLHFSNTNVVSPKRERDTHFYVDLQTKYDSAYVLCRASQCAAQHHYRRSAVARFHVLRL
jgi:hypothetical protein